MKHLKEFINCFTINKYTVLLISIEMNKILPAISAVAPQLPEASQKSVEALKQAVIVLRAMQKSFLLRGAVKDVQEEDAKLELEKHKTDEEKPNNNRQPAETK